MMMDRRHLEYALAREFERSYLNYHRCRFKNEYATDKRQHKLLFCQDRDGTESAAFGHFIAGLQAYVPDLMLVFAPFVNSYRRFVKGSQAPVNLHWGYDNRTTGLRIPISCPAARRVENRIAGADANPYLAIAASLAAGLAGMDEALTPTEPLANGASAYDEAHALARSFLPAHEQMARSTSSRRLLGDAFVTGYAAVKAVEYESYLSEISAWERRFLLPQV